MLRLILQIALLTFFSFPLLTMAQTQSSGTGCFLHFEPSQVKVGFIAYKTKQKLAVPGSFSAVEIKSEKPEFVIEKKLNHTSFSIDLNSVQTGDKIRDGKISEFFFKKLKNAGVVTGKIMGADKKQFSLELNLNGVKKKVKMKYSVTENIFSAVGDMNILDFSGKSALASLAQACAAKHEGKTWPNVKLTLEVPFEKRCEQAKTN